MPRTPEVFTRRKREAPPQFTPNELQAWLEQVYEDAEPANVVDLLDHRRAQQHAKGWSSGAIEAVRKEDERRGKR